MRERQVFRQKDKLSQNSPLVPGNVFMVEPVPTNIYNGGEGDFGLDVCRGHTRQSEALC